MSRESRQAGLTVWSLLAWLAVLGGLVWLVVRVVPLYYQYWTVQTILDTHVRQAEAYDSAAEMRSALRGSLEAKSVGQYVPASAVTVADTDGGYRIEVGYERTVPLTERVRLVYDFRAEAASGG